MLKFKDYNLITEKKIAQIISNLEVRYSLDVVTTKHSFERSKDLRTSLMDYDTRPVTNEEINELIYHFRKQIAENIFYNIIKNREDFVIKSLEYHLSIAITPLMITNSWWELVIKTIFRESEKHSFYVGSDQLVLIDF